MVLCLRLLILNIEIFPLTRSSDSGPGTATCDPSVAAHDWSECLVMLIYTDAPAAPHRCPRGADKVVEPECVNCRHQLCSAQKGASPRRLGTLESKLHQEGQKGTAPHGVTEFPWRRRGLHKESLTLGQSSSTSEPWLCMSVRLRLASVSVSRCFK